LPDISTIVACARKRSRIAVAAGTSPRLEQLIQKDGLAVVGAEYSLETGVVSFFDGVPEAGR